MEKNEGQEGRQFGTAKTRIYVLPEKRTASTPISIKKLIADFEMSALKKEIKVCVPNGEVDKIIEARISGRIYLMRRVVSCGRGCKGCPHGPYWYGYYKAKGRTISFYIGKTLPPRFEKAEKISIVKEIFGGIIKKGGGQ